MMGIRSLYLAALLAAASLLRADGPLVVIVHPDSGILHMTRAEVANIFMGNQKRLASGLVALPVEPVDSEPDRVYFYHLLLNTSLERIKSYWAQLYFSGQSQPPRQAQSADEVIEIVAANKGAVGFVEQGKLSHRVRAVLILAGPAGQ